MDQTTITIKNITSNGNIKAVIIALLALASTACASLCDIAKFDQKTIPDAILNQTYETYITASVGNNPEDDMFNYTFSFNGELPTGMSYTLDQQNRRVYISGTPIESGTFVFTLKVSINKKPEYTNNNPDEAEFLAAISCLHYTEKTQSFSLTVNII
ncbi:MAG: hypothetical protein OEZ39_19440 [Gammaproteobacteria bacterium]|nr:hypothetical protein [Gammaproteobacteria bacterium]MDH5654040.1 hypothetical protein [Gammaproteobacteria bacterium]